MRFAVDGIVDLSFTHRAPLGTLHETGGDHGTVSQGGLLGSTRQGLYCVKSVGQCGHRTGDEKQNAPNSPPPIGVLF